MPWKKRRSSHAYGNDDMPVYGLVDKEGSGGRHRRHHRHHHHHHHYHHSSRSWLAWLWVIPIVLILAGGALGYQLYKSAKVMRSEAQATTSSLKAYVTSARSGDAQQLALSAMEVSSQAHDLQEELSGVEWTIASYVPILGSDVRSVRKLGDILVDISDEALIPLSQSTDIMSLSTLMQESSVNMDAVAALSNVVRQTHPVVTRSANTIEGLPKAHIKQISAVLEPAREALVDASSIMDHALPLLEHLPYLLGADGQERRYLVLGNNIAEQHAMGGFVGMVGMITVQDGHLTLGEFSRTGEFLDTENGQAAGATDEEIDLFGGRCNYNHGDINVIPDYSRVGEMYHYLWALYDHGNVDGVLSFDPVFLQDMLSLVGSIDTSFGVTVDGNNAAAMILNTSLFMWSPTECDDFYKEVAREAFHRILDNLGSIDTLEFLKILTKGGDEGRALAWVANPAAEEAIKQSGFGMPMGHDPMKPVTGFYLSDFSVSKSAYYLSIDYEIGEPTNNADGTLSYPVHVVVVHNADPALLNTDLNGYIRTGPHNYNADVSLMCLREDVVIIGPEGGRIENVSHEFSNLYNKDHIVEWKEKSYQGLDAWAALIHIDVQERCDINYTVVTAPGASAPLEMVHTPVTPHEVRGDSPVI